MATFYMIRHAHKEMGEYFNPRLRHQDEPISATGREASMKLWHYLCDKEIAAVYVSRYVRTVQTIEYTARCLGLTPVVDERLNEIDNGLIERLSEEDIRRMYPEVWKGFRERSADFRFPEGETGEEARRRIAAFLEEKRKVHANENIVAVAHEGLIRLMICHILGLPVYRRWDFRIDYCGVTEISYQADDNTWKLIRFNQKLSETT